MRRISRVAEELLASEEELCFMELVVKYSWDKSRRRKWRDM
jgi:hypothetical protein